MSIISILQNKNKFAIVFSAMVLCTTSIIGQTAEVKQPVADHVQVDSNTVSEPQSSVAAPENDNHTAAKNQDESAAHPQELDPAQKNELNEYLEAKLKIILQQWDKIDTVIEHLAQLVNNNQVPGVDKNYARQELTTLRQTVSSIKRGAYVILDPGSITILTRLTVKFIDHLNIIVSNNLKKFPELDLQDVIMRSHKNSDSFDSQALENLVEANASALKKLDSNANNVGLTLFNRGYRSFEKFIFDHGVIKRTGGALVIGLLGYFALSRFDKESMRGIYKSVTGSETLPGWLSKDGFLQQTVGDVPKIVTINGENHLSTAHSGTLTKAEGWIGKGGMGLVDLTVPAFITWGTILGPFEKEWSDGKLWAGQKWEQLRSYLRGGPVKTKMRSWLKEPKVRFHDIIGKEHHKKTLSTILEYIKDPERFNRAGIPTSPGYLLAGPSRTGKTHFAEALAGEIKAICDEKGKPFEFLYFSAAKMNSFGGNGMGGFEVLMAYARANAPSVVVIDEIDMAGWQRERDAQGLSAALTELSGAMTERDSRDVIVIGITNKPENLDDALKMKGRFGEIMWFDYPPLEDRLAYVQRELTNRSIISISEKYIYELAIQTDECSYDDLNSIIVTALQRSKAEGKPLTEKHLEEAFDLEVRNIVPEDPGLSPEQKSSVALHLAGHTLATILLNPHEQPSKVTLYNVKKKIKEESVWGKYYSNEDKLDPFDHGKVFTFKFNTRVNIANNDELMKRIKILLAGHIAEDVVLGSSSCTYHRHDQKAAYDIACNITFKGMDEKELPKEVRNALKMQAYELVEKCKDEIKELFTQGKNALIQLASELREKNTLSVEEIFKLLGFDKIVEKQREEMLEAAKKAQVETTSQETTNADVPTEEENLENKDSEPMPATSENNAETTESAQTVEV